MKIKKENYKKMKIKDVLNDNQKKLALAQVLNISIPELIINKEKELTKQEEKAYKKIEKKLNKQIPIQQVLKKAYFYNREFYITKNVLIPRPETEELVNQTIKLINNSKKQIKILDIGTGSGVIAITLEKELKNTKITATDISKKALKVAKKNQKIHNTNIKFKKTNLYQGIKDKFDVIISNPPYIDKTSKTVEKQVKQNEPHLALFAKENGLFYYKEIIKNIKQIINKNHIIAFEIGENQGNKIKEIIKKELPQDKIIIKKDHNNYDRYIFAIKNE